MVYTTEIPKTKILGKSEIEWVERVDFKLRTLLSNPVKEAKDAFELRLQKIPLSESEGDFAINVPVKLRSEDSRNPYEFGYTLMQPHEMFSRIPNELDGYRTKYLTEVREGLISILMLSDKEGLGAADLNALKRVLYVRSLDFGAEMKSTYEHYTKRFNEAENCNELLAEYTKLRLGLQITTNLIRTHLHDIYFHRTDKAANLRKE